MRKLQFVFMTLAVLCFAVPVFADGGSAAASLIPIGAGIGMAAAFELTRLLSGMLLRRNAARQNLPSPAQPPPRTTRPQSVFRPRGSVTLPPG